MQNLQEHCREEHNGTGCFECNLCNARVMTKLSLKRHIRSHSGIKEATCLVSGVNFIDMRVIFEYTVRVCLQICGKMFKRSDYLASHYKLHSGTRSYKCSTCGKEFTSKTNLNVHEKVWRIFGSSSMRIGICFLIFCYFTGSLSE